MGESKKEYLNIEGEFLHFYTTPSDFSALSLGADNISYSACFSQLSFATLCPCWLYGHMITMSSREEPLKNIPCKGNRCALGKKGCQLCMKTALCASICYPISPFIGLYSLVQRRYLDLIYKTDQQPQAPQLFRDAKACCCWPCTLLQNVSFYEAHKNDILRFDWEFDTLEDLRRQVPPSRDKTFAIVGPPESGKSELFHRLAGVSMDYKLRGRGDHRVKVGMRPLRISDTDIAYLEVWDVPADELGSLRREISCGKVLDGLLLVFDSTRTESLEQLQRLYELEIRPLGVPCLIVASKEDLVKPADNARVPGHRVFTRYTLNLGEDWAKGEGLPFYLTSSMSSYGVANLLKDLAAEKAVVMDVRDLVTP